MMNGAQAKFGSFSERNKMGAMSAGQKAQAVKEYGLVVHALLLWIDVTKTERLLRYYSTRVEHKKQQLQGLQTMFRNFANQLESGLKEGTPRDSAAIGYKQGSSKKLSKSDQTVSLPNIHKDKPPSQRSGSGRGSAKKTDPAATAPVQDGEYAS